MDWATIGQAVLSGGLQAAGSYFSANAAKDASKKAYKRAKEFAQSGIQWKVADAEKAGINPYLRLVRLLLLILIAALASILWEPR